jgi:uncharacterized damage-inducible protein DinB
MPHSPYIQDTLDLLGPQDPLEVLAVTPGWIDGRTRALDDAALRTPEGPGQWSLVEVLAHLADAEVAFGWRARIVLTADQPPISGFDETLWMTKFHCAEADPADALQSFTAQRRWNMRIWDCAPADLSREGLHAQRGPETFEFMRRLTAGHDLRHRRQIARLLKIVG